MTPRASTKRAATSPLRQDHGARRSQPGADGKSPAKRAGRPASAGSRAGRSAARKSTRGVGRGETPRARGERTRQRVAEALIALLREGEVPPTAKAVAARAGVSVRLVFHHFEDMDALYRMVTALQMERHWQSVREVPADLPLEARIERTVQQRAKLFDAIREVRRAGLAVSVRRPEVAERLQESEQRSQDWLETTFAPELDAAGRERRELLAALDVAASWEAWDRMRRLNGLSSAAARRSMMLGLRGLLHE